ncbi:MAG: DUF58 domain-containing protein [Nannocystaceae bacterium]|nr:DUF58 domain-containing protein [Nannocystaceae bacterium]
MTADDTSAARSNGRIARLLRRMLSARGRRLEITKSGWLFILLTLAVGFAAINSGANLLHAMFGAQMALIIGSGMLSERAVFRASAKRVLAEAVHAETPTPLQVEVTNSSATGELLSVSVEDDDGDQPGQCGPVFAVRLAPKQTLTLHTTVTMPTRGRHRLPRAVIATRFPFGLFVKRRDVAEPAEITVYPRLDLVRVETGSRHRPGQGEASGRIARVGEFFGMREYREGDDPRRIDWRTVARGQRPAVRDYEALGDDERLLELPIGITGDPQFEAEVSRVASMAVAYLQEPGVAVGLQYGGQPMLEPASGAHARHTLLEALALIGERP